MAKRIYVGGLTHENSATDIEAKLRDSFAKFGEVSNVSVIMDSATNTCKGFAFVEMGDAEADAAIAELNGQTIEGLSEQSLTVNVARPKTDAPRNNFGGGPRQGNFGGGFRR